MTAHSLVLIDGRLATSAEPVLHADDRGLRHGDGAFETMRAVKGRIVGLRRHLRRLLATLDALGIPTPPRTTLENQAEILLTANAVAEESVVRLLVTGGRGPGPRRHGEGPPTVLWRTAALSTSGRSGLRVETCPLPARVRPDLKTLSYLPNVLAAHATVDEPLYVERSEAIEGARWNLFARVGGQWCTPPADGRLLPGISRAVVLEATLDGQPIIEAPVPVAQIEAAFVTNAVLPAAPVTHLNGRPLAEPSGLVTLIASFDALADA